MIHVLRHSSFHLLFWRVCLELGQMQRERSFSKEHFDDEEVLHSRADCERTSSSESTCCKREGYRSGLQGSRDRIANVLPLKLGVQWSEGRLGEAIERTGAGELEAEAVGGGVKPEQAGFRGPCVGKLLSPERRQCAVDHVRSGHDLSERHASHLVSQPRGTQRYRLTERKVEHRLTEAIIELAKQYGCYGYRRCGVAAAFRLARVQGSGRVHPAPRRAKGTKETEAARTDVG